MATGSLPPVDDSLPGICGSHDGSDLSIAVVATRWNRELVDRLVAGALRAAEAGGVDDLTQVWVPGAFELPVVCQRLAGDRSIDAVVAIGVVIRGETTHYDLVSEGAATGLARAALATDTPVILGVLATENEAQVLARSGDDETNKGYEAMVTAIEMANLMRELR